MNHSHFPLYPPPTYPYYPHPNSAMNEKPKLKRKSHKKSRLGCSTCRKRKVKCDETFPECLNCIALKKVRCGYLDYTTEQIQLIKLAQVQDPSYTILFHRNAPISSSESITRSSSGSPSEPDSPKNDLRLKLVSHKMSAPQLDLSQHPFYFNETVNNMIVRHLVLNATHELVNWGTQDIRSFQGLILMGCGTLLSQYPELEGLYLRARGICMSVLLNELPTVDVSNAAPLWMMSTALDVSSVFLRNTVSYKEHLKLSTGPLSILQKIYQESSPCPVLKFFADGMLNTTKSVWLPQYDYRVLLEFLDIVHRFGERFINVDTNENERMKEQWTDMVELIEFALDLFSNDASADLVLRYPIDKLYELFQFWFAVYPSEIIVLDNSQMPGVEKVFYVLWLTLLKELESIISSTRYLFSFMLDGFIFTQAFKKEVVVSILEKEGNDELIWYFNFCARVISFMDRRIMYVLSNTILSEPIPHFLHLKDRLKARPLDIHEKCIINFRETVIKKFNYPTESTKVNGLKSTNELLSYYMSDDCEKVMSEGLRYLSTSEDGTKETVDLLHNVNPKTSMLNNDYDPRYIDSAVFEPTEMAFQEADLNFIERYIEDRMLLVQMTETTDEP